MPRKIVRTDEASLSRFEKEIAQYFYASQGRGQQCKVEYFKRGERDYFFAYPADYAHAESVWRSGLLSRNSRRPAFEAESPIDRCWRQQRKLEAKLTEHCGPLKGMHAKTFERIAARLDSIEQRKDDLFLPGLFRLAVRYGMTPADLFK